uniref:SUN domain-containing protein n=1 Tax=Globisporangium ultimum (strain ATCC 200006 / CBS 805.95 / DAOM BR144) TaxID=431595 RepID=K3WKR9_GLOUD
MASYNLRREAAGGGARRMRIASGDEDASSDEDYVFESGVSSSTVSVTTATYRSTATGNSSATTSTTTATPIIQRTLYTKPDEVEDDEEDEEDAEEDDDGEDDDDEEDGDEYVEVGGRAAMRGVEEDSEDDRVVRGARRMGLRNNGAGFFQRYCAAGAGFMRRIIDSQRVQKLSRQIRQFWRYTLRNSFMAANVLWLLAPLGCFLIAIVVPQYLTTAIRYVDILTTRAVGQQSGSGAYEKGTMRSIVQEIVDVKLSAMNEELLFLRNTLGSQEREVEALRVLHESLRQVHDEQQKKFSLADSDSAISIHIERVISKHTDDLSIRNLASRGTVSGKSEDLSSSQRELRSEFNSWKSSLQQDLKAEMSREIQTLEARVSNSLFAEKQLLFDSVESLRNLNAADPAFVNLQAALSEAGTQKAGRVDYAALVNGATVVHSERDLLYPNNISPLQIVSHMIGLQGGNAEFTSQSYCKRPLPFFSSFFSSGELPWWLSRHNGRPETALSETMEIGSCWGLVGSSGKLSVRFPARILVDSVTIDHIPESVASDFTSAPREFQILNQQAAVDGVTLEISSNHGHQEYTCLYRFRVHGTPV